MEGGAKLIGREVDERVVEMQFDNKQFESGIDQSMKSIEKLKQGLDFDGAVKGLSEIEAAGRNFDLSGISSSVDQVANHFSALGIIGTTALVNLTNTAVNSFKSMSSKLIGLIKTGGMTRALNIEQAKFQLEGLGIAWDDIVDDINYGVKDTAYGLDSAARVAAQLVASQVEVGDSMKTSLRAISGVAAMTNSTYDDIGQIFTTVAGNGKLMTEQLRQFSVRGLNAAATLAKYLGVTEAEVREMVTKGQVDFATFAAAMDDAFGQHAKDANKTFTGALSNMKAALSRLGAAFASPALVAGRDIFNSLTPIIDAVNRGLAPMVELSTKAMQGFANWFSAFSEANLTSIEDGVLNLSTKFVNLVESFKMGSETSENLKATLRGLLSLFRIGGDVAGIFGRALISLARFFAPIASGFLSITAVIGNWITGIYEAIHGSELLQGAFKSLDSFFSTLGNGIGTGLKAVSDVLKGIAEVSLVGFDTLAARLSVKGESLKAIGDTISGIFRKMIDKIKETIPALSDVTSGFGKAFGAITDMITNFNFKPITDFLNSVAFSSLLGGLATMVRRFRLITSDLINVSPKLGAVLTNVKNTLIAWQQELSAKTLLTIATALAVLAGALVALSLIDSDKMAASLAAITVLFAELTASFTILGKNLKASNFVALNVMGTSMIKLAAAILVLSFAMEKLAKLNWNEILKGLAGIAGMAATMVVSAKLMQKASKGLRKNALSLIAFAAAMVILTEAVRKLSELDPGALAKGLIGVGVLLGEVVAFMKLADFGGLGAKTALGLIGLSAALTILANAVGIFAELSGGQLAKGLISIGILLAELAGFTHILGSPGNLIATATAMTILGAAMNIFALAVEKLGSMPLENLKNGMLGFGAALATVTIAMNMMPTSGMAKMGISLVAVAGAMVILSEALARMGGMGLKSIGKSLLALAGSLTVLVAALRLMTGTAGAAASMVLVASAIAIMTPALKALGSMPLANIVKMLIALGGAFAVIGAAAVLLAPVTPALLALSGALALLGVAVFAAGAGIASLGAGLVSLAAAGAAGVAAFTAIIENLVMLIPNLAISIAQGFVNMITVIGQNAPAVAKAFGQVLLAIIEQITTMTPQIIECLIGMLDQLVATLAAHIPSMVDSGMKLIVGILQGIASNIGQLVTAGTDVIVNFLEGIQANIGRVTDAGVDTIIALINAIANTIETKSGELGAAAANLGIALIDGIIKGISQMVGQLWAKLGEVTSGIINKVGSFLGINSPAKTMIPMGKGIVEGVGVGIDKNAKIAYKSAENMADGTIKATQKALKINSPSKVARDEIGRYFVEGIAEGIEKDMSAEEAAEKKAQNIVNAFKDAMDSVDLRGSTSSLEYKLWEALNEDATDEQKKNMKLSMLQNQYAIQLEKLELADAKYAQMVEQFGATSDKAREAYNERLQEQYALYEIAQSIDDLNNEAYYKEMDNMREQTEAARDYYDYLRDNAKTIDWLISLGHNTEEEILDNIAKSVGFYRHGTDSIVKDTTYVDQVKSMFGDVLNAFGSGSQLTLAAVQTNLTNIGETFSSSLGSGIQSGTVTVTNAANAVTDSVTSAIQAATPNYQTLGESIIVAIVAGMEAKMEYAKQKAAEMAKEMSNVISMTISGDTSSDLGYFENMGSPVITPEVDTSKVDSAVKSIQDKFSSIMGGNSIIGKIASAITTPKESAQGTTTNITNNNYTMNQTNNSPKPLNTSEIYRQTNNQFSKLKSVAEGR